MPWFGVYMCSPLAAMLGPPQALPFADNQELVEAWHAVAGFARAVPTVQQMHSLLANPHVRATVSSLAKQLLFWSHQGVDAHFRCLLAAREAELVPASQVCVQIQIQIY